MARIQIIAAVVLGALLLGGCSSRQTFSKPYKADNSSNLDSNIVKNDRLDAYSNDIIVLLDNSSYPVDNVLAAQALCFRVSDSEVILAKNGYELFQPGNITKLFASYYVLKNKDIYEKVLVGSDIYNIDEELWSCHFAKNDLLRYKDLIYGAVMYGANDVMIPMADASSGSMNGLASNVTAYLKTLGAENTKILNCYGTSSAGMQTNIYDIYMFLRVALKDADLLKVLQSGTYSCEYTNKDNPASVKWTNALPYFSEEGYKTASGLNIIGGMCENASVEPTQMLVLAQDALGQTYAAFASGCSSYTELKQSIEEILSQISN